MIRCEACGTRFEGSQPVSVQLAGKMRELCFDCSSVFDSTVGRGSRQPVPSA
ncbi:MAG: hypothetical protein SVV03_03400 [Candidatus Nanohaloarchaea archaeon]|nr:hypothetical protein [Candidatus Nanohaloarchaea archaeon]